MRIDLHVHSNVSDGIYPPAEVVRKAKDAGLDAISLSDHDSLAGLPEARAAGELLGVRIVTGCELSASRNGRPVHVLGYFMDESHVRLIRELAEIRENRRTRARQMVDKLNALGVPITYERVLQIATGESVGRPHIAQAMVEAGVVRTTNEAFTEEWIGNDGRAYVEKKALTPDGAIALVREAGGVSVLAHPVWLAGRKGEPIPVEFIRSLATAGLSGLEVDHPDQDAGEREVFRALAQELNLVVTGSSDFHGDEHGGMIGANTTSEEAFGALRERAGR